MEYCKQLPGHNFYISPGIVICMMLYLQIVNYAEQCAVSYSHSTATPSRYSPTVTVQPLRHATVLQSMYNHSVTLQSYSHCTATPSRYSPTVTVSHSVALQSYSQCTATPSRCWNSHQPPAQVRKRNYRNWHRS